MMNSVPAPRNAIHSINIARPGLNNRSLWFQVIDAIETTETATQSADCPRDFSKSLIKAALVILAAVLTTFGQYADAAVGRTAGEALVSASGEATYSIPLNAPRGINDLTPELALVYGHRMRGGLAGVGWNISGLSKISRCGKTTAQDGAPGSVDLDHDDRFCRDGRQLRLVTGTYGGAGSTYRTEIDTISRYTAYGTAGNGPAWFEIEAKSGLIYEFGNSADSRIESLASGWESTAIIWALNKISDRSGIYIL